MDTPPPVPPPIEFDAPMLDVFGSIFKLIRVVAIFCSLLMAGAGAVLAWNFYYFVADIIQKPGATVQQWQTAMAPIIQGSPIASVAPAFKTTPDVAPSATAPAETTPTPTPAADATQASPPESPDVSEVDVQLTPGQADPDTKLVLGFADSVLDRFQAGHFSWLLGMGFLAFFCWVLGKVPGVLIAAGTRVLLELLKVDKEKP